MAILTNVSIPIAAFAITALLVELAGTANLGVSFGIGQIAFALAAVYVLLRR